MDSFPGDLPPHGADLRCYLKAQSGVFNGMNASSNPKSGNSTRNNNDYMNTQNAFPNLSESLKALEPSITGIYYQIYFLICGDEFLLVEILFV